MFESRIGRVLSNLGSTKSLMYHMSVRQGKAYNKPSRYVCVGCVCVCVYVGCVCMHNCMYDVWGLIDVVCVCVCILQQY